MIEENLKIYQYKTTSHPVKDWGGNKCRLLLKKSLNLIERLEEENQGTRW